VSAKSAEADKMLKMLVECIFANRKIVKVAVKDSIYDKLTLRNKKTEKGNRVRKLLLWKVVVGCCVDEFEQIEQARLIYTHLYPSIERLLVEQYLHWLCSAAAILVMLKLRSCKARDGEEQSSWHMPHKPLCHKIDRKQIFASDAQANWPIEAAENRANAQCGGLGMLGLGLGMAQSS
jgi:hypothetical protein